MPSLPHEELTELFQLDPSVLVEMLRASGRFPLPDFDQIEVRSGDLRELLPAEFRADTLVVLEREQPVMVIVAEVQLHRDDNKRYSWPCYVTSARARYRCPACLLVYAPDEAVSAWASTPIDLGQPGSPFVPVVLGPRAVPYVRTEAEALRAPYRAVLSALSHANEPGELGVAVAAWVGLGPLPADRRETWRALLLLGLSDAVRKALEDIMNLHGLVEQTPFYKQGLEQGLEKGLEQGLEKGLEKGLEQGLEKGRVRGKAEAVVRVLEARGLALDDDSRQRILGCQDPARLDRWLTASVTCASTGGLLASP